MTGSKSTILTSVEMQAIRESGESKTDWTILRENAARGIEPEVDDDSQDVTDVIRATIRNLREGRPTGGGTGESSRLVWINRF